MTNWDERWMSMAEHVAGWSKDQSTKVGAVVVGRENQVLSLGYNGFPRRGADDVAERHERPAKYLWTEHAERNAVYNACRSSISLVNSTMYASLFPCSDCARAIIQSGISEVVTVQPDLVDGAAQWTASWSVSLQMLVEAQVCLRWSE